MFSTFHSDMKPRKTKRQVTIRKKENKRYRSMTKSVTQHSYFEKKPSK
jgi:hypothetical protein